jgi:hypothetical protein
VVDPGDRGVTKRLRFMPTSLEAWAIANQVVFEERDVPEPVEESGSIRVLGVGGWRRWVCCRRDASLQDDIPCPTISLSTPRPDGNRSHKPPSALAWPSPPFAS